MIMDCFILLRDGSFLIVSIISHLYRAKSVQGTGLDMETYNDTVFIASVVLSSYKVFCVYVHVLKVEMLFMLDSLQNVFM